MILTAGRGTSPIDWPAWYYQIASPAIRSARVIDNTYAYIWLHGAKQTVYYYYYYCADISLRNYSRGHLHWFPIGQRIMISWHKSSVIFKTWSTGTPAYLSNPPWLHLRSSTYSYDRPINCYSQHTSHGAGIIVSESLQRLRSSSVGNSLSFDCRSAQSHQLIPTKHAKDRTV